MNKNSSSSIYRTLLLIVFTLSILTGEIMGQSTSGIISGEVRDAITKQPLPGANIIIVGTNIGAASDVNGYYVIKNVAAGKYTLRSSMMGYEPSAYADLIINPNRNHSVVFELRPAAMEMNEINVTADYFSKPVENRLVSDL